MEHQLQLILLMSLMMGIVNATQKTFVQNTYRKLKPEQIVTGTMGEEVTAESNIECCGR